MAKREPKFPTRLSRATSTFLAACDEVRYTDQTPIAATAIEGNQLILYLGTTYDGLSDQAKAAILEHEVAHFCLAHPDRMEDRDAEVWNIVTDSAIHHLDCCDWQLLEQEIQQQEAYKGFKSATFERIGLAPMPPEVAYHNLMSPPPPMPGMPQTGPPQQGQDGEGEGEGRGGGQGAQGTPPKSDQDQEGEGDGEPQHQDKPNTGKGNRKPQPPKDPRGQASPDQDPRDPIPPHAKPQPKMKDVQHCGMFTVKHQPPTAEILVKRTLVTMKIAAADPEYMAKLRGGLLGGQEQGGGREVPELAPPKPWIRQVLQYLTKSMRRQTRSRSWRREHRGFPEMLPGQSAATAHQARILLDASGSITQEMLAEFLSAVSKTPELEHSDVVVFDTSWSDPIPVNNVQEIATAVGKKGGGTSIRAAGMANRPDHMAVVWLTDAYSGDGWPSEHKNVEVWCVHGGGPKPPHGHYIKIEG